MYQAGLVLEGGGMKGVYTAGVLDFSWTKNRILQLLWGIGRSLPPVQLSVGPAGPGICHQRGLSEG